MRARLCGSVSGRHRTEENFLLTKHVVAAGTFAKDAGSTPAASTTRAVEEQRSFSPFAQDSHSGRPKQRTLPVYCLGKKHSYSLGENRVLPPPTYTRPRDSDGPAHTGPSSISLSTLPVAVSRATNLPLPTAVKYATPLPTATPEATT